jgi:hypothetical protein
MEHVIGKNELAVFDDVTFIKIKMRDNTILTAIVDTENIDIVKGHSWSMANGYVNSYINGRNQKLARLIMNAPSDKQVDHINHDLLNNTKSNLRLVNKSQNQMNRKLTDINNSGSERYSKYKGVSRRKANGTWRASIGYQDKLIHLGTFQYETQAAHAYDVAATELFGSYALTNEVAIGRSC